MQFVEADGAEFPRSGSAPGSCVGEPAPASSSRRQNLVIAGFDTAQIYENEREVGEGVRASGIKRDELFVTTKVWTAHFAPNEFERSAEESLRQAADALSICCCHRPIRMCRCRRRWAHWRA